MSRKVFLNLQLSAYQMEDVIAEIDRRRQETPR